MAPLPDRNSVSAENGLAGGVLIQRIGKADATRDRMRRRFSSAGSRPHLEYRRFAAAG
jgi:hypothetical protein